MDADIDVLPDAVTVGREDGQHTCGESVQPDGDSLAGKLDGVGELAEKLSQSKQVHDCLAVQWYRWALGRVEAESDACAIAAMEKKFYDTGGDFEALQLAIPRLRGAYALAAIPTREPGTVVATPRGLPLVVGLADNAQIISPNTHALVPIPPRCLYLA